MQSSVLLRVPHVIHGFGTAQDPIPVLLKESWESRKHRHRQVHLCNFAQVQSPGQECGEVDGLFTFQKEIPVGIMTADCVPILMAHKKGNAVAAIHAGWRGTRAHILRKLWNLLQAQGEKPADWVAAIGPAIGPCCYEVTAELAAEFLEEFKYLDPTGLLQVPSYRHLDLQSINAAELKKIGLSEVEILRSCTRCSVSPAFHSYRREGGGTRQWSMIMAG